jgi:hypothetical protein
MRFDKNLALARFPELAANHMIEEVKGRFCWQGVPTRRERQWRTQREQIECLRQERRKLDQAMLANQDLFLEEGDRTDELVALHETFICLTQQKARLEVDRDDLRAQAIQHMESYEAVLEVCSYRRRLQRTLNAESFRTAHRAQALESATARDAYVRRRIFLSRSY